MYQERKYNSSSNKKNIVFYITPYVKKQRRQLNKPMTVPSEANKDLSQDLWTLRFVSEKWTQLSEVKK